MIKLAVSEFDVTLPPVARPLLVIPFGMGVLGYIEEEGNHFVFSLTNGATMMAKVFAGATLKNKGIADLVSPFAPENLGLFEFEMMEESRFADVLEFNN